MNKILRQIMRTAQSNLQAQMEIELVREQIALEEEGDTYEPGNALPVLMMDWLTCTDVMALIPVDGEIKKLAKLRGLVNQLEANMSSRIEAEHRWAADARKEIPDYEIDKEELERLTDIKTACGTALKLVRDDTRKDSLVDDTVAVKYH